MARIREVVRFWARGGLLLILIFAVSSHAVAWDWGFKLGLSWVGYGMSNNDFPLEYEPRSTVAFAAFAGFPVSSRFSIQPEVFLYMEKGANFYADNGWRFKHMINYLEFPILLKFRIPFKGRSVPEVFAGPYYAREMGSETINIFDNCDQFMIDHQGNLDDAIQDYDYGLVFGGAVKLDVCFGRVLVEARYHMGLANILKDAAAYNDTIKVSGAFAEGDSLKNRALLLMFGVSF